MDNVDILIDGVLTVKIVDPVLASYKNVYPLYAVTLLAHTTVREEAGKFTLEKTSKEAGTLQEKIVIAINEIAKDWGVKCLRYEIRNISQPGGGFGKLLKKLIGEVAIKAIVNLVSLGFGNVSFVSNDLQRRNFKT